MNPNCYFSLQTYNSLPKLHNLSFRRFIDLRIGYSRVHSFNIQDASFVHKSLGTKLPTQLASSKKRQCPPHAQNKYQAHCGNQSTKCYLSIHNIWEEESLIKAHTIVKRCGFAYQGVIHYSQMNANFLSKIFQPNKPKGQGSPSLFKVKKIALSTLQVR